MDKNMLNEATSSFKSLMERMDYVQKNGSISLNEVSLGMYQRAIDNASRMAHWGYEHGFHTDEDGQYVDSKGRRFKDRVKKANANLDKLRETDPIYQQAREIFDPDDVEWDGFEREYGETYGGCTGVAEYDDGWRFEVYAYMDSPEADPDIEEVYFHAPDGQHGYLY